MSSGPERPAGLQHATVLKYVMRWVDGNVQSRKERKSIGTKQNQPVSYVSTTRDQIQSQSLRCNWSCPIHPRGKSTYLE